MAGIQSIRMLLIITGFGGYLLGELNTMLSTSAILIRLNHHSHVPAMGFF